MRKRIAAGALMGAMLLCLAGPAGAVEAGEATYVNGTLPFAGNTSGRFDTKDNDALVFRMGDGRSASAEARIPYDTISNVDAHVELARHLGVLPAIGVALVRKRERKHMLSLTYVDGAGKNQVAVFEVSKGDAPMLLTILNGKAAHACSGKRACMERSDAGE